MTDTNRPYEISQQSERNPDVLKLIYLYRDQCKSLLKVFHDENLKLEDVASARDAYGLFPIHNVLFYSRGEGVLELVRYLVELDPDCVKRKTHAGLLPIHVMPGIPFTGESTSLDVSQNDQLKARIFLMKQFPEGLKHINQYGRSALSEAIKAKCNIIVKAILDESPELAKWPQENGRIPLHLAIEEKNSTAINLLLHSYPEGLTACDKSGKSPLMATLSSLDNARDLLLQVANVSPFLSLKIASENAKITEAHAKKVASDSSANIIALQEELRSAQEEKAKTKKSSKAMKAVLLSAKTKLRAAKKAAKRRRGMPLPEVVQSSSSFSSEPEQSVKYRSLIDARKSEIISLSNIGMQHSIMDLKKISESLIRRLGCMGAKKRSVAQIATSYYLQVQQPQKQDLYQTIQALNNELMELERHSPAASREAHASPIISATDTDKDPPRKRARVNDNDDDDRTP
jgi:hypothetical protein